MTKFRTFGLALIAAAALATTTHAETFGDLTLTFPALKSTQGKVMIAVYDSAQGWASGKPARVAMASAADASVAAKIVSLPPGTYAVRAFQDVDENGKLNTNPFGLPVEPYGFSHDAQPNMGPPTFDAAAFEVKAGANAQAIHLK
jgi:uncharacterized protein (DUF2141 family)